MTSEERRSRIADHLRQAEFASLEDLASRFGASASTLRRDLIAMEATGAIRRTHGGARLVTPRPEELFFAKRDLQQASEKESIGAACAGLLGNRRTVILDAGSTVFHVAAHLERKAPQVFTNSLPVANLFASSSQVEVIVSGGLLYPRLGVLVGPLAERAFSEMHVDVAILGASGITADGIYNTHALLIGIQRAMIGAARKVIFCLDHTKFGRRSMSHVCKLDEIHCVVTDKNTPAEALAPLRDRGIEVIVAGPDENAP